ncbi:hypothetical protein D3C86_1624070 [compost metagenome]
MHEQCQEPECEHEVTDIRYRLSLVVHEHEVPEGEQQKSRSEVDQDDIRLVKSFEKRWRDHQHQRERKENRGKNAARRPNAECIANKKYQRKSVEHHRDAHRIPEIIKIVGYIK